MGDAPRADELFFLLGIRDFDDGVDENARRDDGFGIDAARLHEPRHLDDRTIRRGCHQRREVARRHAVGEIAVGVAGLSLDQRIVRLEPALLHIGAPLEFGQRFALGQIGAEGGRRVEGRDARASRAYALGERALWHKLELELAREIFFRECARVCGPRKGADRLPHHAVIDHRRDADPAVSGVVVHDGDALWRVGRKEAVDERVDQLDRRAGAAESADHDHGPVGNVGDRLRQ